MGVMGQAELGTKVGRRRAGRPQSRNRHRNGSSREKAGKWKPGSGKRREGGDESGRFFPPFPGISGHFPPFPTFSHFIFILWPSGARFHRRGAETQSQAELGTKLGKLRSGAKRGRESPRKFGLLRVVTRCFTKVRTDQGRGYAIVRIVTGGTLFQPRMDTDEHG